MDENLAGRHRVVIENLRPRVEPAGFAIKRIIGDEVTIEVDAFTDGHDHLVVLLRHRKLGDDRWQELPMESIYNDRYRAKFTVTQIGRYEYTVQSWVDRFHTWRYDLTKRAAAGQELKVDLMIGSDLVDAAALRASAELAGAADATQLHQLAEQLRGESGGSSSHQNQRVELALDQQLLALMNRHADRSLATSHNPPLEIIVDRPRACFSTWYELFPRSCSSIPGKHGTLRDVIARLPYVASMGFDILYMPPIHPVGDAFRKGKNNAPTAQSDDVGSPWGIGSAAGGHKSIHPELGTLEDFIALRDAAQSHGIELALDIAFQCSPDHPYVKKHPDWFRARPDGTIQYAENPPKKYQDIYPFDFECNDWRNLWQELRSVFQYWIDQGVRVFRVDNPHTKPFPFWQWVVTSIKAQHPDVLFLAEAFTRPKIMYRLAKLGYSQSYTYFTWRNHKQELIDYFTELTQTDVREIFRPNLWPNTPDILHETLQTGGRAAFQLRLILAATLGANYGIYGPAYELGEHVPREPGSEEYLNSEKYEVRQWDLDRPNSLRDVITRINRIRREHVALQSDWSLQFHTIANDQMLAYSKRIVTSGFTTTNDLVLVVANLNPHVAQSGWLDLSTLGLGDQAMQLLRVVDLLTGKEYHWTGSRALIELNPAVATAHVFQVLPS